MLVSRCLACPVGPPGGERAWGRGPHPARTGHRGRRSHRQVSRSGRARACERRWRERGRARPGTRQQRGPGTNEVTDSAAARNRVPSEVAAGATGWRVTRAAPPAASAPTHLPAALPGPASARPAQPSIRRRVLPAAHQRLRPGQQSRAGPRGRAAFKRPSSAEPQRERAARGRGGQAAAAAARLGRGRARGREPVVAQLFP